MDRRKGAGRPRTVNTEENAELVEELICSQEDEPHTHLTPRQIESTEDISRSFVRIVNEQAIDNFKLYFDLPGLISPKDGPNI